MATISVAFDRRDQIQSVIAKWLTLTTTNLDGESIRYTDYQDRSVQVLGTFGGGTVTMQGSNDGGTTWATLTDPLGNNLAFTAAGMKQITELPDLIRPLLSGGDGTTDLDVYLHMRGRYA